MVPDYDSILMTTDSNVINRSEYYTVGKGKPDRSVAMEELPYSASMDNVLTICFVAMFIVLSFVLYHSRHVLAFRFKTFFTTRRVYSTENANENKSETLGILSLSCVGALSLGIMFYYCLSVQYQFPSYFEKPHWVLALSSVAFFVLLYLRALVYSIVNWVFFEGNSRHRWNVGYFLLASLSSYVFYTIAVASVFFHLEIKSVTLCVLFVYVLYEILHLYKLFVNFKFKSYGALLIFLYFCSVEMLPLMLIWRLFDWVFNSYFVNNLLT